MNLLILELDGCLITPKNTNNAICNGVADINLSEYAYEKLMYFKNKGYTIAVLTNQPYVAQGIRTVDDVYALLYAVNHLLGGIIGGFVICPHDVDGVVQKYATECECRKPRVGMYKTLLDGLGITDGDIDNVVVVGNTSVDKDFAKSIAAEYQEVRTFF